VREKHILSASIKSREAFQSVAAHVGHSDFSEQGWVVWENICDYYDADSTAGYVDAGILSSKIARKVAADKHKEMFTNLVATLDAFDVSGRNVVDDLLETKREVVGHKLAHSLLAGEQTALLLTEYEQLLSAESFVAEDYEDARQGYSVEELCATGFNKDNLIQVMPASLNERLDGGVKPGHHIILFARPEMGKTMMTIEMMAGFLRQGLTVLYIGNEDPIDDINMRVVNRLSGMTKLEVMTSPNKADVIARQNGYEQLILKSLAPGTVREITGLIEKYSPHVLVLDQLRNLNMKNDNYVLALEQAAKQARQWGKRYSSVVVSVTQAGDSATGKAVLDMGDVDFSNTGIPSQADVMIGLGAGEEQIAAGEIVLSLPKNKVSGRHEYFACTVEASLSKIMSI
jgi:KaiC/GvpD/RAD55 family RecA-like ATPase